MRVTLQCTTGVALRPGSRPATAGDEWVRSASVIHPVFTCWRKERWRFSQSSGVRLTQARLAANQQANLALVLC